MCVPRPPPDLGACAHSTPVKIDNRPPSRSPCLFQRPAVVAVPAPVLALRVELNALAHGGELHLPDRPGPVLYPVVQVRLAGVAHGRELGGCGLVPLAHQGVDGRGSEVFAHQRHELVVLLAVSG